MAQKKNARFCNRCGFKHTSPTGKNCKRAGKRFRLLRKGCLLTFIKVVLMAVANTCTSWAVIEPNSDPVSLVIDFRRPQPVRKRGHGILVYYSWSRYSFEWGRWLRMWKLQFNSWTKWQKENGCHYKRWVR